MSELIPDAHELKRLGDINILKGVFNEPTRLSWLAEDEKKLSELYELGKKVDAEDPVGFLISFNRSHPFHLSVGIANTRLDKILEMLRIYIQMKASKPQIIKEI